MVIVTFSHKCLIGQVMEWWHFRKPWMWTSMLLVSGYHLNAVFCKYNRLSASSLFISLYQIHQIIISYFYQPPPVSELWDSSPGWSGNALIYKCPCHRFIIFLQWTHIIFSPNLCHSLIELHITHDGLEPRLLNFLGHPPHSTTWPDPCTPNSP